MSSSDVKQALKDAKAAIDASQWAQVVTITAGVLGLPDQNGSNEFDALASLSDFITSIKDASKELTPAWYQMLVFRGMGLSNEAKAIDKTAATETAAERAKSTKVPQASTFLQF